VEGLLPELLSNLDMLQFREEKLCQRQGYLLIAGIDEVGRGCLAGPVVASAVIMPYHKCALWYQKVRDSKLLTSGQREYLSPCIHEAAISIGTGVVDSDIIDYHGMTFAVRLAMKLALARLQPQSEYALIDYLTIPDLSLPHKGVINGDTLCFSIACASIVAKVFRDHMMVEFDKKYPGYGFARHKGYGTREHAACLRRLGPCPLHRRSFQPVRDAVQLSFDDISQITAGLAKRET
jgi:ribonuclease HII